MQWTQPGLGHCNLLFLAKVFHRGKVIMFYYPFPNCNVISHVFMLYFMFIFIYYFHIYIHSWPCMCLLAFRGKGLRWIWCCLSLLVSDKKDAASPPLGLRSYRQTEGSIFLSMTSKFFSAILVTTGVGANKAQPGAAGSNLEERLNALLVLGIQSQQVELGQTSVMTNLMSSSHSLQKQQWRERGGGLWERGKVISPKDLKFCNKKKKTQQPKY